VRVEECLQARARQVKAWALLDGRVGEVVGRPFVDEELGLGLGGLRAGVIGGGVDGSPRWSRIAVVTPGSIRNAGTGGPVSNTSDVARPAGRLGPGMSYARPAGRERAGDSLAGSGE
jgi:hypothetical protein